MTSSKTLFLRQEELRKYLASVVHSDSFNQCWIYCMGELLENKISAEQLSGVQLFKEVMNTICDEETDVHVPLSTGLIHDLEPTKPLDKKEK